jgi:outer membrane protein TolC
MKTKIYFLLILLYSAPLFAQERDLGYFISKAKENSPLNQKNRNASKIANLDLEQIKRVLSKAEVKLEGSLIFAPILSSDNNKTRLEWASNGANNYVGYDLAYADGGHYEAIISAQQPLFTKTFLKAYTDKAGITQKINENAINLNNHDIEHLVTYQYLLCLKSKQQSEISLALLKQVDEQLNLMKELVKSALYKQTDLLLLQIEEQNYQAEYQSYKYNYLNNLYDLNLLCGINESAKVQLKTIHFELNPDLKQNSKFLKSFELDSLDIISKQSIFNLKYKPQLNLIANAGQNAIYLPNIKRFGFSTALSFSWTLFDGKQQEVENEKSKLQLQNIAFEKNYFINQNSIQKIKILEQLKAQEERIENLNKRIEQYMDLLSLYKKEFKRGQVSIMDYKNLIRDIEAKKQDKIILQMQKQNLINSYNYWNY